MKKYTLLFCFLSVQALAQTPDQQLDKIIADTWAFHDALPGQGSVTLPLLEKVVDDYIRKAKQ